MATWALRLCVAVVVMTTTWGELRPSFRMGPQGPELTDSPRSRPGAPDGAGKVLNPQRWIDPLARASAVWWSSPAFGEDRLPSNSIFQPAGAQQDTTQSSHDATESSRGATQSSRNTTQSSREATQSSRNATQSSRDTTQSSRDATQSSRDATQSSRDATQSSRDATQSSRDATQSSRDATQSSRDATQSSRDATQSSHNATQSSHNATQPSRQLPGATQSVSTQFGNTGSPLQPPVVTTPSHNPRETDLVKITKSEDNTFSRHVSLTASPHHQSEASLVGNTQSEDTRSPHQLPVATLSHHQRGTSLVQNTQSENAKLPSHPPNVTSNHERETITEKSTHPTTTQRSDSPTPKPLETSAQPTDTRGPTREPETTPSSSSPPETLQEVPLQPKATQPSNSQIPNFEKNLSLDEADPPSFMEEAINSSRVSEDTPSLSSEGSEPSSRNEPPSPVPPEDESLQPSPSTPSSVGATPTEAVTPDRLDDLPKVSRGNLEYLGAVATGVWDHEVASTGKGEFPGIMNGTTAEGRSPADETYYYDYTIEWNDVSSPEENLQGGRSSAAAKGQGKGGATASENVDLELVSNLNPPKYGDLSSNGSHGVLVDTRNLLVLNKGITVAIGSVHSVNPETDLKINILPGHHCTLTQVQEPKALRLGRLSPPSFPCDFAPGEVQYTHLGSRHPTEDVVKLLLRYDTEAETLLQHFSFQVRFQPNEEQIVSRNLPLKVRRLLGASSPITSSTLRFDFDEYLYECRISLLTGRSSLPKYGNITSNMGPTHSDLYLVPCLEFLGMEVRYIHLDESSTKEDHIPAVVELYERGTSSLYRQEYFQFVVSIEEGRENTPPTVSPGSLLRLEVNQFVMTAITPSVLSATDKETPPEKLIFRMKKPLGFGEGLIVSTDDQTFPILSFYQKDLEELKIVYKPPLESSEVARTFVLKLEIVDDEGLQSVPFELKIVVFPKASLGPLVLTNTGLTLFEGQSRQISPTRSLEIVDEDNLEDVVLTLVAGPKHGRLLLAGKPTSTFSPAHLDAGTVQYVHDGSDTYTDNLLLHMTDGSHNVTFLFAVTLFPVDDEPPVAHVNTGLELKKGQEVLVTPFVLSATDVDSDDADITFVVQDPISSRGMMLLRRPDVPPHSESWELVSGMYESPVTAWTQRDITDGFLLFRHLGQHEAATVHERIYFTMIDSSEPPNESEVQEMVVTIHPVDDVPPIRHREAQLFLMVDEYKTTVLTKESLSFTDQDSDDGALVYRIRALQNVDADDTLPPGQIVRANDEGAVLETFTQSEINHFKVAYKPPREELGIVPRTIQFEFDVEDEAKNVLKDQVFTLFLNPVDNQPPVVHNAGLHYLPELGRKILTAKELSVEDSDTDLSDIVLRVLQVPDYGVLQYGALTMTHGNEFTQKAIEDHLISYTNSRRSPTGKDAFLLEVTDGVHVVPVTFTVTIQQLTDEPLELFVSSGTLNITLKVLEGGQAPLTAEMFSAFGDHRVTFDVLSEPLYGGLLLDRLPTRSLSSEQISKGKVVYRHDGAEIGRSDLLDEFDLALSDLSDVVFFRGNRIERVRIAVTVEPVDNVAPEVIVHGDLSVEESLRAPLTTDVVGVSDVDTDDEELSCTVTRQPKFGYIENVAPAFGSEVPRKGIPITYFRLEDLKAEKVFYVQSLHTLLEARRDSLALKCSDGVNISPIHDVDIEIRPLNDEMPELAVQRLVVKEGNTTALEPPFIIATDTDLPEDELLIRVITAPRHGVLMKQTRSGELTKADQFAPPQGPGGSSSVVYVHDDSETAEDVFELELSDGKEGHAVRREVHVTILPKDDESPRLAVNTGLSVDIQEVKPLTRRHLAAVDLDTKNEEIAFLIRNSPMFGKLQYRTHSGPVRTLAKGMNFTQLDVDQGRLQYRHLSPPGVRDLFRFDLSDGTNINTGHSFHINVQELDHIFPKIVSRGVEVPEGGKVTLTTDVLSASDLNSPDDLLSYTITRVPQKGFLSLNDQSDVPITAFTQLDLAASRVAYTHTSEDEKRSDFFEFVVSDSHNSVYRTFRISITPVDDKRPVLFFSGLTLPEGGIRVITPFELRLEDRDTKSEKLRFLVAQAPQHGRLLRNKTSLTEDFSQVDLERNLISYHHDGSETLEDVVEFRVTDSTHNDFFVYPEMDHPTKLLQRFPINITPVDNGVPAVVTNEMASSLDFLLSDDLPKGRGENFGVQYTRRVLEVQDRDTPPEGLRFTVVEPPKYGILLVTPPVTQKEEEGEEEAEKGSIVTSAVTPPAGKATATTFTQYTINDGRLFYILHPDSNATSDSFKFTVVDRGNNTLEGQVAALSWSIVRLGVEVLEANETQGQVIIPLHRRGFLGHTSIVQVAVVSGSSTLNVTTDLTPASPGVALLPALVQFSPGQTSAFWSFGIKDNAQFEGEETLTLRLEEPIRTRLEDPRKVVLHVHDDEDVSAVEFALSSIKVEEDVGEVALELVRSGDITHPMSVSCVTFQVTAKGSGSSRAAGAGLHSGADYMSLNNDSPRTNLPAGSSGGECRVRVLDDALYEDPEEFLVGLVKPTGGVIGQRDVVVVTIERDSSDVPVVFFEHSKYEVGEAAGKLEVVLKRQGSDLRKMSSALIVTSSREAQENEDFQPFEEKVFFPPGIEEARVVLFLWDDVARPRLEGPEEVELLILTTMNADLGSPTKAIVVIDDSNLDLPRFEFSTPSLTVEEESDEVAVEVLRRGDATGEASVVCYSRQDTATTPHDFEERPNTNASLLLFSAGERSKICAVTLVDDSSFEGQEHLRLVLGAAYSSLGAATLGRVQTVLINITDEADRPAVEFESRRVSVREPALAGARRAVKVVVLRKGDLGTPVAFHVFTRDGTARAGKDYVALSQEIVFDVFESRVETEVVILGDIEEEHREVLNVILEGSPNAPADFLAFGSRMTIYIQDRRVASATFPAPPVVMSLRHYMSSGMAAATAGAPAAPPAKGSLYPPPPPPPPPPKSLPAPPPGVPLVCVTACHPRHPAYTQTAALCGRSIDSTLTTYSWRVSTPPLHHASAPLHHQEEEEEDKEGDDLAMEPLLYHATSALNHQEPPAAARNASSVSPSSASSSSRGPGRLLLGSLALQDPPSPLVSLNAHTFMAGTKDMVLDSIFFGAGSVVQCAARPLSPEGYQGLEIKSEPVVVALEGGPCPSMSKGSLGAPPFTAKLYYGDSSGVTDRRRSRRRKMRKRKEVGLEVVVPHTDGLLPLVSTKPLHNLPYTLGLPPPLLQANHPCSNLHPATPPKAPQEVGDDEDLPGEDGIPQEAWDDFYDGTRNELGPTNDEGADADLLEGVLPLETRRFYESLNLDTCTWYWTSWYSMSQLLEECGGRLVEQEEEGGPTGIHARRLVTVEVPLYVSYVFHSPHMYSPWRRSDLSTSLRMSFAYDPSILRQEGVVASSPGVRGVLHPTAVTIRRDGTLHVLFDTEAKFEGGFVAAHPTSGLRSRVTRDDQPDLPLTLTLLRSPQAAQTAHQQWQFVSDYALHDYSGNYTVRLVSCLVDPQEPTGCSRARVVPFRLQVTFEQVAQPVEQRFSLNAAMNVFRLSRLLNLAAAAASAAATAPVVGDSAVGGSGGGEGSGDNDTVVEVSDAYFRPGDRIYVQVELEEGGGSGLLLRLRRCWVCAGRRGYVPKYLPGRHLYGCLGPESLVAHSFKVVDRDDPDTVQTGFGSAFFNVGDPMNGPEGQRHGKRHTQEEAQTEEEQEGEGQWQVQMEERHLRQLLPVGADGFAFDVDPLFQVSDGLHWFVHCIYEVGSTERTAQGNFDTSPDGGFLSDRPFPNPSEWLASHPIPTERPRNYLQGSALTGSRKTSRGRRATEEEVAPPDALDVGTRGKGTNMHRLDLHPEPRTTNSLQQVPPHRIVLLVVSGLVALGLLLSLIGVQLQTRRLQRR